MVGSLGTKRVVYDQKINGAGVCRVGPVLSQEKVHVVGHGRVGLKWSGMKIIRNA